MIPAKQVKFGQAVSVWAAVVASTGARCRISRCFLYFSLLLGATCYVEHVAAQEKAAGNSPAVPAAAGPNKQLADEQARLADKYRRMEELLFKMADFEATSHPRRAALLKQAYKQSKDRLTYSQLAAIVKLLGDGHLKRAVDGQQTAEKDLETLLKLLQTENRADRLKTETQRIQEYIKELKRLERLQRSVRGQTEGGGDMKQLAENQRKVADRTGNLAEKIEKDSAKSETPEGASPAEKPSEKPAESKSSGKPAGAEAKGDKSPGDSQSKKAGEKKDTQDKPGGKKTAAKDGKKPNKPADTKANDDQKSGQQGKSADGSKKSSGAKKGAESSKSQGQGKPSESQNGAPKDQPKSQQQQPAEQQTPKRVREAEEKMREARQRLEEAKRGESVEKQREAEQKLKEAIAKLEEVLRQLREEEMSRMLALLEGRFRKMLEMQLKVYEGTVRLGKIPTPQRTRAVDIRANKLAFDQRKITREADSALTLLLEEGSSVAFPEVVGQMRDDMQEVGARLAQTKVDRITQGIEEEIVSTLEEMIEALQKAQQDMDKKKAQQSQSQPSEPGEMPLVDILSELKMVRSLQFRVNSRTKRYSRLLDDVEDPVGQAMDRDLRQALRKLGEREQRLQQITRDIVLEKNK